MKQVTTAKVQTLPAHPTLVPGFTLIQLPNGAINLRSPDRTLTLRGKAVPYLIQLIKLLDGTRDLQELAELLHLDQRATAYLIERLQEASVLVDKDDLLAYSDKHFGAASVLSRIRFGHQQYSHQGYEKLKDQIVGICGSGELAQKVRDLLLETGVQAVHSYDLASIEDGQQTIPNFLIYVAYIPDYHTALRVNALALRTGTPWVAGWFTGTTLFVTHVMQPEENACFECLLLRQRACYLNIEEDLAYERHLRASSPDLSLQETTPGMEQMLAAFVTMRALGALVGAPVPKLLEFSTTDLASSHHPVLRLPRCPACGPMTLQPKTNPYINVLGEHIEQGGRE